MSVPIGKIDSKNSNPVLLCLWMVLFLEFLYIFGVLFNYYFSWMHIEVYGIDSWVLSNGHGWRWEDFIRALNTDILEGPGAGGEDRITRPVANFLEVVNPKFRAWCWNYFPPHPSLSVWWPVSFIVLPYFLYKFFKNMKCHPCVSFGGVILYLSSIGFLASNVMYFRASKNLVNIFAVISLYLGSKLYRSVMDVAPGATIKEIPKFRRQFLALLLTMFVGLFSDETAVFIPVMVCAFFYQIPSRPKERAWLWAAILALPVAYIAMVLKVLPYLHLVLTGKVRDFRHFDLYPGKTIFFLKPSWWEQVFVNGQWLLADHPHVQLNAANLFPNNKLLFFTQLAYTLSMVCVVFLLADMVRRRKMQGPILNEKELMPRRQAVIAVGLIAPFIVFHTLVMTQLMGLCYYGALYSLVYFIALTFLFQLIWDRGNYRLFRWFLPVLVLVGTLHGLLFSTYRVDMMDQNKWSGRFVYDYKQIFTGQTPEYFRNFTIMDGVRKSECRYLYIATRWAQHKGKKAPLIDPKKIQYCDAMLAQDRTFPLEAQYLKVEQ